MNIIKTEKERTEERCRWLDKIFVHKRFLAEEVGNGFLCMCYNYFDKINLALTHRAEFYLMHNDHQKEDIFNRFSSQYDEFRIEGFKLYWNYHKSPVYLYVNPKYKMWEAIEENEEERYRLIKTGVDQLIVFLRQFL